MTDAVVDGKIPPTSGYFDEPSVGTNPLRKFMLRVGRFPTPFINMFPLGDNHITDGPRRLVSVEYIFIPCIIKSKL